jgi:hypothetical protein
MAYAVRNDSVLATFDHRVATDAVVIGAAGLLHVP